MRRLLLCAVLLSGCASAAAPASQPQTPVAARTTSVASPSPTITGPPRSLTISGSGDILIHPSLWGHAQADGLSFEPALAGAQAAIRKADYAICHVEQGVNSPDGPVTEYPNYYTHPVLAEGIAETGFDACSTASNWTWLKGLEGIERTNRALKAAGVAPAGSRYKPNQPTSTVETVNGVEVAHLSFTDPADSPGVEGGDWAINRGSAADIIDAASTAREAGAEVVVVSLAMGQMGSTSPTEAQDKVIAKLARSGQVNLVIGHGSHTIQGAEEVDGMWVVWHGNLLTSFFPDQVRMHEGLVSRATLTEQPDGSFAVTKIGGDIVLSLPQTGRLIDIARQDCTSVPARWQQAYDATRAILSEAIDQGFVLSKPCSKS